jgi:hypothetical protein
MIHEVEIYYDKDGAEISAILPYNVYAELILLKDEIEELRNKLRQISFIISESLEEPRTAKEDEEFEIEDLNEPDAQELENHVSSLVEPLHSLDVRYYQRARGYYVDGRRFCVMKGSKAKGSVSPTFHNLNSLSKMRDTLIQYGILNRSEDWCDFEFTRDYVFPSPSAAAGLVDGNSRSGPDAWGSPRIQ